MIPGYGANTPYSRLAWDNYGINVCGSAEGCAKGLGWTRHRKGHVDRAGTIHWYAIEHRATKPGMRQFLKLVAMVMNRDYWTEPNYRRIFLTNVWAHKEAKRRYHMLWAARYITPDRKRVNRILRNQKKRSLRYTDRNLYLWLKRDGLHVIQWRWE